MDAPDTHRTSGCLASRCVSYLITRHAKIHRVAAPARRWPRRRDMETAVEAPHTVMLAASAEVMKSTHATNAALKMIVVQSGMQR